MTEVCKMYVIYGISALAFGAITGTFLHRFGFPWGAVIMIASGVYCLLEGVKLWVKSILRR